MGRIGMPELLIILGIIVLIFGARRIPELMRGLGEGIRTFKEGMSSDSPRASEPAKPAPPVSTAPPANSEPDKKTAH